MKRNLIVLNTILVISLIGCSTNTSTVEQIKTMPKVAIATDDDITTSASDVSMNQPKASEPVKAEEEVTYSKFITFLDDPSKPYIQPGAGGILIEEEGCLLVQASEKYVPIFPNSSTS